MEIDLALNNEVEDFKEDYESIYLEIIQEACKQLGIHDDLELSVIFVDDQRIQLIMLKCKQKNMVIHFIEKCVFYLHMVYYICLDLII